MKLTKLLIAAITLATSSLAVASECNPGTCNPLLKHTAGQDPFVAAKRVYNETRYFEPVLVKTVSDRLSISKAQVMESMLDQTFDICSYDGAFTSNGIMIAGDSYKVGSITRESHKSERFACRNGKILWSGRCGNGVISQDPNGKVTVLSASKSRKCTTTTRETTARHVESVSGVAVGDIYIGEETYVTKGFFKQRKEICEE